MLGNPWLVASRACVLAAGTFISGLVSGRRTSIQSACQKLPAAAVADDLLSDMMPTSSSSTYFVSTSKLYRRPAVNFARTPSSPVRDPRPKERFTALPAYKYRHIKSRPLTQRAMAPSPLCGDSPGLVGPGLVVDCACTQRVAVEQPIPSKHMSIGASLQSETAGIYRSPTSKYAAPTVVAASRLLDRIGSVS